MRGIHILCLDDNRTMCGHKENNVVPYHSCLTTRLGFVSIAAASIQVPTAHKVGFERHLMTSSDVYHQDQTLLGAEHAIKQSRHRQKGITYTRESGGPPTNASSQYQTFAQATYQHLTALPTIRIYQQNRQGPSTIYSGRMNLVRG